MKKDAVKIVLKAVIKLSLTIEEATIILDEIYQNGNYKSTTYTPYYPTTHTESSGTYKKYDYDTITAFQ